MRIRTRHHGIALLIVITTIGLAAVIGFAMLSSAALQQQVGSATARAAGARYAAESGLQSAIYFLQNPSAAPASWTSGGAYVFLPDGVTAVQQTFAATAVYADDSARQFDVSATPTGIDDTYLIASTGRSEGETPLSRSVTATVQMAHATIKSALNVGGALTIPSNCSITGSILTRGVATTALGATVTGTIRTAATVADYVPPTAATISYYGGDSVGGTYLMPDGSTGIPQAITSPLTVAPVAAISNPGHVFYCAGNLAITNPIDIDGTLVVRGKLTINSNGSTIRITAHNGFPAAVVDDALTIKGPNETCVMNGVVWAGNGTAWTGASNTNSSVAINGALLMPAGKAIASSSAGTIAVTFNASNVNVPHLTTVAQPIASMKYLSFAD